MTSSDPPASEPGGQSDQDPPPLGAGFNLADPTSPLAWCYLHTSQVVVLALLALLFFYLSWIPVSRVDVWGHLAFGRWIAEHAALPPREPFTPFADQQSDYVPFQWLTQLTGYLVYSAGEFLAGGDPARRLAGGAELYRTAFALLAVVRYGLLYLAYRRLTGSSRLACAGVVLVLLLLLAVATQRPQAVGECLFAATLLVLVRPVLTWKGLVAIPALFVVWANAHGSFVVGFVLVAVFLLGRVVEVVRDTGSWHPWKTAADSRVGPLALALVAAVAAVAVLNPRGPWLYWDTVQLSRHPNIATFSEWEPLVFEFAPGGHWGYLATLLLLLASQALSPKAMRPSQVLLLLTFGLWPCFSQRMFVWWALVLPVLVLPLWAAAADKMRGGAAPRRSTPNFLKTVAAVVLVAVGLLVSSPVRWLLSGRSFEPDVVLAPGTAWQVVAPLTDPRPTGDELAPLAEALKLYPEGRFRGAVFASETQGDYLVWALPPDTPVLAYSHGHLFPPDHWKDVLAVKEGDPLWRDLLRGWGANLVVVEPGTHERLAQSLRKDPEWVVVVDGEANPADRASRQLFVALRKQPLPESRREGRQ